MSESIISKVKDKTKNVLDSWFETRMTTPVVVIRILRPVVQTTTKEFFLNMKDIKTFKEKDWLKKNTVKYEVIYGSESEITEGGQSLNSVQRLYSKTETGIENIIENKKQLKEGIIGIQIEEASVYGSLIQISVADFTNDVLNNVRSNDIIFAWVFDLDELIKDYGGTKSYFSSLVSSNIVSTIIDKNILPTDTKEGVTPHFSGFVTAVHKHIKDKSRTNIEGLDLNKYLQHYSIPNLVSNESVDRIQIGDESKKLIGKGDAFTTLSSFFGSAIIEALKKEFITLDIKGNIETLRYEEFLIRRVEDIKHNIKDNKVYISFLKGSVSILTIHPLILLKCIYKYFFHLIGLGAYMYPEVDFKDIEEHISKNEIDNKNLISVGIIYKPKNGDLKVSEEFNKNLTNAKNLRTLLIEQEVMFTFTLSGEESLYISEHTKDIRKSQALFTIDGQVQYDAGYQIPSEDLFGFDTDYNTQDMERGVEVTSYHKELINYARSNIYRTFKETIDIDSLLSKNSYTMRSEKFLPVNQYVSTTLKKLRDGVPLLFLIKALFYVSTGIYEPVYTWTELEGKKQLSKELKKDPPKFLNSIRNTMWIKINFELVRKEKKLFLKAVLRNNFVSHKDAFTDKIEIKEEDILEYQSSSIRYPLSVLNIKTQEGFVTITDTTYEKKGHTKYMNFHPSSIVALNLNGMVSKKLPIFTNSYTITNTSFCPSIHSDTMGGTSVVLFNKTGPPSNVMSIYHHDQPYVQLEYDKEEAEPKLIIYKNERTDTTDVDIITDIGGSGGEATLESGEQKITPDGFYFGDEGGVGLQQHSNAGVIEYLNPISMFKELQKIRKLIKVSEKEDDAYSSYGSFNYSQYKNLSINILYDKEQEQNPHTKFIYEDVLGIKITDEITNKTITFLYFLTKVLNYFYRNKKMRESSESFWARKTPTRLWVYNNLSFANNGENIFSAQSDYTEIAYNFERDYYYDVSVDEEPMLIRSTEVSKYIYAIKFIMGIYIATSRYYDELLATQAVKSSIYIPASIDINIGDKVFITDDRKELNLDKVGKTMLMKTSIGIAKEGIYYLPKEVRDKPLFCWKRVIYVGDAGGTSGFTRKVYLTNNPFNWVINFEEKDLTTRLAASIQNKLGLYEVMQ